VRLRPARAGQNAPASLIAETDPRSPASEAYRALRTNIQFAGLDQPCRCIVVTSATAGEGKTTSVANFGAVCAQAGSRIFGLDNTRGLTTALLEGSTLADVARPTRVPNLFLVTSGPLPPNPAELVGGKRMRELLDGALGAFDLVVCDSPPVIAVSDGVALAAQCDGVILIVRVGVVAHDVIRRATEQIQAVKGKILGVLLNDVDLDRDGYHYKYYRYYQSTSDA